MSRHKWVTLPTGILIGFIVTYITMKSSEPRCERNDRQLVESCNNQQAPDVAQLCGTAFLAFKEKRDSLSKQLNAMKQEYGKLNCKMNLLTTKRSITTSGSWCKDTSAATGNKSRHVTDYPFAEALSEFFRGKRVASFGDGPGTYKKYLDKTGLLSVYDAYDGAPYCDEVSKGAVKFLDLTAPQYGLPVYDWVVSLEVAEHIPPKFESVYIDNIVRHAKDGIVLSWAIPTQTGHGHVNGKSFEDVLELMNSWGFEWDEEASKDLRSKATRSWFRRNVSVFRRLAETDLSTQA